MIKSISRTKREWIPTDYLQFTNQRLRPALDLIKQIPPIPSCESPQIVDLGCGTGNMVPFLRERWPNSEITCVDSSAEMLAKAKVDHKDKLSINYVQSDFEHLVLDRKVDLIFSNAALHWVSFELHKTILPKLLSNLNSGGVLAFQIPDSRQQHSHLMMRKAAEKLGLDQLLNVRWVTCEASPQEYYELFDQSSVKKINMWSTSYCHVMEGPDPVYNFTKSTGLGPYVEALSDEKEELYVETYKKLLRESYPSQKNGNTLFEMKRFFCVVQKD